MSIGTIEGKIVDVKTTNFDNKEKAFIEIYSDGEVCRVKTSIKGAMDYKQKINDEVILPIREKLWNFEGKSGISRQLVETL